MSVDALGKLCPLPVIELAKVIGDVPVGGTVTVLADDEAARLDIPAWCEMRGQEYVGAERHGVPVCRGRRREGAALQRAPPPRVLTVSPGARDLGRGVVAVAPW